MLGSIYKFHNSVTDTTKWGIAMNAVVSGTGRLAGKVALITGSGRGIGKATALKLAREGASVVINDIDADEAHKTLAEIHALGAPAVALVANATDPDFGERIVALAIDTYGSLDIIVNNAGYTWDSVIQKMSDEQWAAILDIHLTTPFRVLRAAQPYFSAWSKAERAAGTSVCRKVVNISSVSGTGGIAGQVNYSSAKAGIVGMTKTLAKEWGRYNVTVNAVAFGFIETRLTERYNPGEQQTVMIDGTEVGLGVPAASSVSSTESIPLGRAGTPDEAAGAVYLFCSPESSYVSGETLVCSGGAGS